MPAPGYVGVGAFRSGTSSLARVLEAHPQVGVWKYKETYYFNRRYKSQLLSWYLSQFRLASGQKVTGEITPSYFGQTDKGVHERLAAALPEAKVLLLLRDPVQTTISAYWMRRKWGKRDVRGVDVSSFLFQVARGQRPLWFYRRDYAARLKEWFAVVDRDRFWIAKSEDLWLTPDGFVPGLWRFLGVANRPVKRWPKKAHFKRGERPTRAAVDALAEAFAPMERDLVRLLGDDYGWRT